MQQPLARVLVEDPKIITPQAISPAAVLIPKSFAWARALKLSALYLALFTTPIAGALGVTHLSTIHPFELNTPVAVASQTDTNVQLASAQSAEVTTATTQDSTQGYSYEVALANGFLKKAIELSNSTTTQTADDKQKIVQLLTQALEAANRAIQLNPTHPDGYTSRGRIYQATSVVKPEMKTLADQDFAKASALGSANPTQAPTAANPAELLPTEQAQGRSTAMIAGPEQGNQKETVTAETQQNAKRGTAALAAGKSEITVSYPAVKDTTQLYVTAENNPENLTIYVKNKEAGTGFTIASTSAPSAPLEITWWEIE